MNWSRFDRIYCFHCTKDKDRYPVIREELARVGILGLPTFSFVYTSFDPWERFVADAINKIWKDVDSNRGFINLGLATARTMREALYLGYERVLFLEDDVRFLKDLDEAQTIIDATPDGYDLVQYDKFPLLGTDFAKDPDFAVKHDINGRFFDATQQHIASGACFMAKPNAMRSLLMSLEITTPRPVDGLFGVFHFKRCCATKNLGIQEFLPSAMMHGYVEQASNGHLENTNEALQTNLYDEFGSDRSLYNLVGK